ncbi:hypothetical protein PV11_10235 [Exophiala sideris]|uniref:Beta-lactamase-related domain-containing protein n=1 Tax=Exophiala sideris TaxID=1016849 RepID=A0A0D1WTU1_9EURO|nr:hypothetical protein PV11_10235 [Exophiala sideris]
MAVSVVKLLKNATSPGPGYNIPGAVLLAANKSGNTIFFHAQGYTSVDESVAKPITADAIFWIASCTKLMTTISALQCVERGLLALDEDVSRVLPELKSKNILTGFTGTKTPIFQKATRNITLRHLLTHSSGLGYDFLSPTLKAWQEWNSIDISTSRTRGNLAKEYDLPLLFEPGEGWEYGVGIDWVGRMIERVHGRKLGDYMREHIWEPLGMESTTFHLDGNEDLQRRLCLPTLRHSSGELTPAPKFHQSDPEDDLGGGGIYTSPRDYMQVLTTILQNDGKLLKPETVDLMFQPHLVSDTHIKAKVAGEAGAMYRAGVDSDGWNFGLGGILNTEDVEGVCKKGTLTWGGLPNLYWWIDPAAGNCGLYASQVLPPADKSSMDVSVAFRRDINQASECDDIA